VACHEREILIAAFGPLEIYLVVKGAKELQGC
jgi:hypothetical protein